jgi:hypothetical protein
MSRDVASGSSTLFQAQAAQFHFSPDSGPIAASHRSATKSADAQRGAAHGEEWKRPPREWFEAKTQFAVVFGERFVCQ